MKRLFFKNLLLVIFGFGLISSLVSAQKSDEYIKPFKEFSKLPVSAKSDFFSKKRNAHVLVDSGHRIWGMAVIKWNDGKYHGYYARWQEELGHDAWLTDCEIVHAVADSPEGPFKFVNVVLRSRNTEGWDIMNSHNPAITVADGKICLYYISNDLNGKFDKKRILSDRKRKKHWNLFRNSQRIGVAIATAPDGPFVRSGEPVVEPDNVLFKNIAVNPAVTYVNGKYIMIIKGDKVNAEGWFRVQLVGHADNPEGPFIFQENPVYDKEQTEDAGIWYDQTAKKYYMTCHVMGQPNMALFSSADSYSWEKQEGVFSKKEILLEDGSIWKPDRMERPFILTDETGQPICLYVAISDQGINGNIAIPIKSYKRKNEDNKSWFSKALDYKGVVVQDDNWHIWGCSPIQDEEGKTHLFIARWPVETGHEGWYAHSQIAHYVGENPEGPFRFSEVVLEGTGKNTWDQYAPHNPTIHKVDNQYALFYIANDGIERRPSNQKIGLLLSETLNGPWRKAGKNGLVLGPPSDRSYYNYKTSNGVNNPAFLYKDGKYLLYFKSNDTRNNEKWAPKMGLAIADKLEGPYIQKKEPITKNNQVIEDGYAFQYNNKVYLVTTDNHGSIEYGGGLIWESDDGFNFNSNPKQAFTVVKNYLGGKLPSGFNRTKGEEGDKFERPQILMIGGKPAYMYMPSGTNVKGGRGSAGYVFKIK